MASTRFPGKALARLGNCRALTHLLSRLDMTKHVDIIRLAVPVQDRELIDHCKQNDILYFEGDPENVRRRVLGCAIWNNADIIVDITGDCPLVDPHHVDELITMVRDYDYEYASNIDPRSWPDGFDVQVYHTSTLQVVHDMYPEAPHVGWQILNLIYRGEICLDTFNLPAPPQLAFPEMRLTLDTPEDAEVLSQVFRDLGTYPSAIEVVAYMLKHPKLQEINRDVRTKTPEEG